MSYTIVIVGDPSITTHVVFTCVARTREETASYLLTPQLIQMSSINTVGGDNVKTTFFFFSVTAQSVIER